MASAKHDFEGFVRWLFLPGKNVPAEVRRLSILVLANFDAISATSRQRNQRSNCIVGLIRKELESTKDIAPEIVVNPSGGHAWPWVKLRHLTLGPFRGFKFPESFDLSSQITLFYGPNGAGKTSLCEGLEYALLGDVEDAGTKRIAANTYLTNVHAQRFDVPSLKAIDSQGAEIDVLANPDQFRFCFVEKNRIDAFSRIAARPSVQRSELIATLFGMDQFNDFVSHFNETIDSQLVLRAEKQNELALRRKALAVDIDVVSGEEDKLRQLIDEESALAQEYLPGFTYEELKNWIGASGCSGRLQELDKILGAVPPNIIGVTRQGFLDEYRNIRSLDEELNTCADLLRARSDQVSFKNLYESVLALQGTTGRRCPACDTPLDGLPSVVNNPYSKALVGLSQLEELGQLQEQQKSLKIKAEQASRELRRMVSLLLDFLVAQNEQESSFEQELLHLINDPAERWWAPTVQNGLSLEGLLAIVDRIKDQDDASRQALKERQSLIDERKRLIEFQMRLHAQATKRMQFHEVVDAARKNIKLFDLNNFLLIQHAGQEILEIRRDNAIKFSYDYFMEELRKYRGQLPAQLMAGLNEDVRGLYNLFNRNDDDGDKLAALYLPVTGDGKIEISFRRNPGRRVDALHVLSEGHIRCLGLAILLAKANNIKCPVIVFDDAINAIDHDHRGGIREALFESDIFSDTQLIVTCHSNEFIKDIQQHLPAKRRAGCQVYLFRHHIGDYQPRVKRDIPNANYIAKARLAHDVLNAREALAASRQALEMLSEKVWRWLGSHNHGLLNLPLAGVGAEPALRNLCDALAKKLKNTTTFSHVNKDILVRCYDQILGISATNFVWVYLNKGTHEEAERDDFDRDVVERVIQALEDMDRLDLRGGR